MADCSKCNRTDIKCCHTCKKDAEKCNVWHNCGSDCPKHETKVITKADNIRSMSDEELADMLHNIGSYVENGEPMIDIYIGENKSTIDDSFGFILDWLQSEAE